MQLRTIADTVAVVAACALPGSNHVPAEVADQFVTVLRLLQAAWQHDVQSVVAAAGRHVHLLTEEMLVAQLLVRCVGCILESHPENSVRRQAKRFVSTQQQMCELGMRETLAQATVLPESLRYERLRRRLDRWTEVLLARIASVSQPRIATEYTLDLHALRTSASGENPLLSLALRLSIPNRCCQNSLRSELLQQMCGTALRLIPETAFQTSGQMKCLLQRRIEQTGSEAPYTTASVLLNDLPRLGNR